MKSILQLFSLSGSRSTTWLGIKIGKGLAIWKKHKYVPLCTNSKWNFTAKIMNIWLSIVHNILKRFWESREISVQEAHGWKSALDHCHIWALVQHYIKTRMILSFWVSARAREHFQKRCCLLWTRTKAGLQWKAVLWSDDWRSRARVVQNQLVVSCYTHVSFPLLVFDLVYCVQRFF